VFSGTIGITTGNGKSIEYGIGIKIQSLRMIKDMEAVITIITSKTNIAGKNRFIKLYVSFVGIGCAVTGEAAFYSYPVFKRKRRYVPAATKILSPGHESSNAS
jgi:hypothetical protein